MRALSSILCSMLACGMIVTSNPSATSAPEAVLDAPCLENSPAAQDISPNLQKNCELKQTQLQLAIAKFGAMGVGVTPFQSQLNESKQLLTEGKASEASSILARLESNLVEQQNRYYSNKWQSWHNERKLLAEAFRKKEKHRASIDPPRSIKHNNMSKAVGSVVSKKDTKYNPMIYPIAR